jgi:hypothetical protein
MYFSDDLMSVGRSEGVIFDSRSEGIAMIGNMTCIRSLQCTASPEQYKQTPAEYNKSNT